MADDGTLDKRSVVVQPADGPSFWQPLPANGKNIVRPFAGTAINTNEPTYLFLAVPNSTSQGGVVDVLNIASTGLTREDTNAYQSGTQSIPADSCNVLVDYFRQ